MDIKMESMVGIDEATNIYGSAGVGGLCKAQLSQHSVSQWSLPAMAM